MLSFTTSQTKTVHVRSRCWLAILLFAPLLVSCRKATQTVQPPAGGGGQLRPYTGQLETDDGQWVRATKDYANTRYSSLDQINTGNVASLKVAWTFDTGVARGQEAAPIVANNTMYVVAPWPNTLFALDLTKPGALEDLNKHPFTIKEGATFRMKARFKVQHEVLSGLKYVQVVSRLGVKNKMQEMIVCSNLPWRLVAECNADLCCVGILLAEYEG